MKSWFTSLFNAFLFFVFNMTRLARLPTDCYVRIPFTPNDVYM